MYPIPNYRRSDAHRVNIYCAFTQCSHPRVAVWWCGSVLFLLPTCCLYPRLSRFLCVACVLLCRLCSDLNLSLALCPALASPSTIELLLALLLARAGSLWRRIDIPWYPSLSDFPYASYLIPFSLALAPCLKCRWSVPYALTFSRIISHSLCETNSKVHTLSRKIYPWPLSLSLLSDVSTPDFLKFHNILSTVISIGASYRNDVVCVWAFQLLWALRRRAASLPGDCLLVWPVSVPLMCASCMSHILYPKLHLFVITPVYIDASGLRSILRQTIETTDDVDKCQFRTANLSRSRLYNEE